MTRHKKFSHLVLVALVRDRIGEFTVHLAEPAGTEGCEHEEEDFMFVQNSQDADAFIDSLAGVVWNEDGINLTELGDVKADVEELHKGWDIAAWMLDDYLDAHECN